MRVNYIISFFLFLLLSSISSVAFADCDQVGNREWEQLYGEMVDAYKAERYDDALTKATRLEMICNESPTLLYTISEILRNKGRELDSYSYVVKAATYSTQYELPQTMHEKIWYRRFELDSQLKRDYDECKRNATQSGKDLNKGLTQYKESFDNLYAEDIKNYTTMQWTGTGLAIGGGIIGIVSAAYWAAYHVNPNEAGKTKGDKGLQAIEGQGDMYIHQWEAMMSGLTVGGFVVAAAGLSLAVFSAVKLNELKLVESPDGSIVEDVTLGFDVSPTRVGMTLNF